MTSREPSRRDVFGSGGQDCAREGTPEHHREILDRAGASLPEQSKRRGPSRRRRNADGTGKRGKQS